MWWIRLTDIYKPTCLTKCKCILIKILTVVQKHLFLQRSLHNLYKILLLWHSKVFFTTIKYVLHDNKQVLAGYTANKFWNLLHASILYLRNNFTVCYNFFRFTNHAVLFYHGLFFPILYENRVGYLRCKRIIRSYFYTFFH